MGVFLLNMSRKPEPPHHSTSLESGLMNPRMSMSGRMSVESQGAPLWNYASVGSAPPAYADGQGGAQHGRRSRLFREQNSTLFNAFEEEGVALTQLPEESDEEDGDARDRRDYAKRSLVGSRREVDGGRHPAYEV